MGRYLDRLRKDEMSGSTEPTKPTKASNVGFVGDAPDILKNIGSFVGFDGEPTQLIQKQQYTSNSHQEHLLVGARNAFFSHLNSCPTCSVSWNNASRCPQQSALWLVYQSRIVDKFGIELVFGVEDDNTALTHVP